MCTGTYEMCTGAYEMCTGAYEMCTGAYSKINITLYSSRVFLCGMNFQTH